ncbi:MAG: DUF485 domain-containing protein [Rhodocyclaceae bacterium]|jgi:uncharacterized membrane protein (DUF485 family)|nr:DUF485 domain-containing protein [Rhodocyclaceae bacterium]MBK6552924.1 DUF485 domain-containing protein [Rhodocyclaceae bacterium]MBK6676407.1 DUF485 domain-containing protein [Rhodocyclaceae bacterium]MBK9312459.1 DUF485 domain-containing protein [Rhodocyclaceae bacterium]MBK9955863.1 DUF485 domain-containing protein [Rhodocyclaceae bacterium]
MAADIYARIRANPKFAGFVSTRNRYSIVMAILGAIAYYGFILLVAYDKEFLARKLGAGMVTSLGIPIGVGVIVFTIIITWVYVRRANGEFDDTNAEIIREAQK